MSKRATEFQRKEIEENKVDIRCAVLPTWFSCPLSSGVFRLSLTGSSPGIPYRRSCGFQGAVLIWQQKIATQQPEPDHPFWDGLGSGLPCSDQKVKNLLRSTPQTRTCRGEAPPSCCARPFCRLKAPVGLSLLRFASQT